MWMNQLPVQARAVLSINTESSLDVLAAMADKMLEHTEPFTVATMSRTSSCQKSQDAESSQIEKLSKKLDELSLEIAALRAGGRQRYRRPFHANNRSRSRSRSKAAFRNSPKPGDAEWQCRYHFRFGDRARRCESPCCKRNKQSENQH
jgi:hypothetical protein